MELACTPLTAPLHIRLFVYNMLGDSLDEAYEPYF